MLAKNKYSNPLIKQNLFKNIQLLYSSEKFKHSPIHNGKIQKRALQLGIKAFTSRSGRAIRMIMRICPLYYYLAQFLSDRIYDKKMEKSKLASNNFIHAK